MWDIPYFEAVIGCKPVDTGTSYITVSDHNARFRHNGKMVHSCSLPLPAGAIVNRYGQKVSSPELLFLELSSKLSIHRLILLGLQLCSHPPGQPFRAITTKQRIAGFLSKTSGHRGHNKAVRAIKYVINGSASIMESLSYMILALPHALGGYGLSGAVFNHEIIIQDEAINNLGQTRCFADLYYKEYKLAVEYDSFAYHSSPSEQGKDIKRSAILENQGIDVIHFSTIQLYDTEACRFFANNLAYRLEKRITIRTKKFDEMHALLRTLLPTRTSVSTSQANDHSVKQGSEKIKKGWKCKNTDHSAISHKI